MKLFNSASAILWLCSSYFFLCGASAIVAPELWLLSAGLSAPLTPELTLVFGVAGVYLVALGYGAARSARATRENLGIVAVLIVANIIDFVVTLRAVLIGHLPPSNGALFLVVTIVWVVALGRVYSLHHQRSTGTRAP